MIRQERNMKPVFFGLSLLALVLGSSFSRAALQKSEGHEAEQAAIRQAALDYIEGWYEGDAERMERSLHPELAKRIVSTHPSNARSRLDHMGALTLIQSTRRGSGKEIPKDRQKKDVVILDQFGNAASVKVTAADWIDYMHLAKWNGRWVIVNVLWERTS
jgi:hypothetical protein